MQRRLAFCALLIWCSTTVGSAQVPRWTRFEATLESSKDYDNPLQDVQVEIDFLSPSGKQTAVPAFWDGYQTWRVRFSPNEVGSWSYRWRSSDTSDSGLHGQEGRFECAPYQGANPLYNHGAVDVATEGRYFAHADGTPFFWLGDTAWNGVTLSSRGGWETYLRDRQKKHFSVIQFVALPWRSAAANADGRPAFYGREKIALEPVYFQRMDERVDAINEHGMLAAPVMFWTHSRHVDLNPGMYLPEDQLVVLGRYLIARYGAHHVAWILGGDGNYDGDRAERWRRVGRALFGEGRPGIRRPVTVHATYWCADAFRNENWWTFNGYQSGHRVEQGLIRITSGEPTEFWKTDPKRPLLNIEPNYEAHRDRTPGATGLITATDMRRAVYLSLLTAPPAGVTYGAHGIWAWHPRAEEPMTHPGTGVGPAWRDAMNLPGSLHLKYMAELFQSLDWTKLRPAQQLLARQPGTEDVERFIAVAKVEGGTVVAYLASGGEVEFRSSIGSVSKARWFNPRTGEWLTARAASGPAGDYSAPRKSDWVLVLER